MSQTFDPLLNFKTGAQIDPANFSPQDSGKNPELGAELTLSPCEHPNYLSALTLRNDLFNYDFKRVF